MDNIDYKSEILPYLARIKKEIKSLDDIYIGFFKISEIFSSENGGKTRLNRQLFNENHELIVEQIAILESILGEALEAIKLHIKEILDEALETNKIDLQSLVFDDTNFLELLELDLNSKVIVRENKRNIIKNIRELFKIKNRLFNYKYFLEMFNTTIFDKLLNKLGIEDLINSSIIFEIIDSYGLQYEELQKFKQEIENIDIEEEKIISFQFLNNILELHKRKVDNFIYANVRYKIALDYNNELDFRKAIKIKRAFLENIISNLIEHSCMDVIKKELKKGKIQKTIEVFIEKNKGKINLTVKNNGFDIKNIYTLYTADIENRYILEARNLANMMDARLDIQSIENEGMVYTLIF